MRDAALWRQSAVAALLTMAVAGLGAQLTELGPWYRALVQPPWKPPDIWFGPAWTLIFTLTATGAVLAWRRAQDRGQRRALMVALAANALLNIAWSGIYFTLRRPDWALVECALLWLSTLWIMQSVARIERRLRWWLLPYVLWVLFAMALNTATVQLNGPF